MVIPAGAALGLFDTDSILASATAAGNGTLDNADAYAQKKHGESTANIQLMPQGASFKLRSKMWLDYQNDVKVSDVQLAAREGYESVEHTKRYTTLGMATDQGKLSNINGLSVLADALNVTIPQVGTTTFRPPYTPVTIGALGRRSTRRDFPAPPPHAHARKSHKFKRLLRTRRPLAQTLLLPARRRKPTNKPSTAR